MNPEPDLFAELDAAEDIVMDCVPPEVQRLRDHIDTDHGVMVQLGLIADSAVKMLEHVNMDTEEDRELHARAVSALRGRLDEIAATMKETNGAADWPDRGAAENGP